MIGNDSAHRDGYAHPAGTASESVGEPGSDHYIGNGAPRQAVRFAAGGMECFVHGKRRGRAMDGEPRNEDPCCRQQGNEKIGMLETERAEMGEHEAEDSIRRACAGSDEEPRRNEQQSLGESAPQAARGKGKGAGPFGIYGFHEKFPSCGMRGIHGAAALFMYHSTAPASGKDGRSRPGRTKTGRAAAGEAGACAFPRMLALSVHDIMREMTAREEMSL